MDSQLEKDLRNLGADPEKMYLLATSTDGLPTTKRGVLPECICSRMDLVREGAAILHDMEYVSQNMSQRYVDVVAQLRGIIEELRPFVQSGSGTIVINNTEIAELEKNDLSNPVKILFKELPQHEQYASSNHDPYNMG